MPIVRVVGDTSVEIILDAMEDGALVLDGQGIVLHANSAACRLLASSAQALKGRPAGFSVPTYGRVERVLPSGATLALQVVPIIWRGLAASLVVLRPMAARKLKMDHAEPGDHLYRLLVENLPDGDICLFDRDLRFLVAEGSAMGRHGLDRASFMGKSLEEAMGAELAQSLEPLYSKALAGQESELELELADHVYRVHTVPIRNEQGEVVLGLALSQDITRLKHSEREVRKLNAQLEELLARERRSRADADHQRRLLRDLLDQAPAMMCLMRGPTHVYEYVNEIYCKSFGRTEADFLGRSLAEVFPEVIAAGFADTLDQVYRTGETFRASEVRALINLGQNDALEEMYCTFSYQAVRDADGQVCGILVHAVNVTEQVLARRAVEQKSNEVARLNRELKQRVRDLAAANKELEAFAYSVSHDLRAPLRRIDGFGQVLLEEYADRLDRDGVGYLQRIRAAAEHMGELIDDLLMLSQVSRKELELAPVDLSELARRTVGTLHEQAPERQVTVQIAPDMRAWADAGLLRIVLDNLLENAWKFTSKRPQAAIELGTQGGDGELAFYVRDNGAGFDPAYGDKLFDTFTRLHSPSEFPGVGIGLATAKRVIDRHGGRIWAEGAVDQGATFYFTLPSPQRAS